MLKEHVITKVYFTTNELRQLTGFSKYDIYKIIKIRNVPYNKCKRIIRIHKDELNEYFNIKI